jgi:hypothetical protein
MPAGELLPQNDVVAPLVGTEPQQIAERRRTVVAVGVQGLLKLA